MSAATLPHDWFPQPLPPNVEIGPRSWLYSAFAFRHFRSEQPVGLRIGRDTGLYNGTFFDLGPCGRVEIGDFSTLVGAIVATNGQVRIGSYAFIAHEVVIADRAAAVPPEVGSEADLQQAPEILIGDDVWIGTQAVVLGGAQIGEGAIIGAAAVIDGEVPPFAIAAGNPWRIVGWVR